MPSKILLYWRAIVSFAVVVLFVQSVVGDAPRSSRPIWTESRIVGFPDPPPPFEVQRVFDHLEIKNPLKVTALPGTDDLLVHVHKGGYAGPGRLLRFSPKKEDSSLTEFLVLDEIIYGVAFHPDFHRNGYLFVGCNGHSDALDETCTRVLRFQVSPAEPLRCDPASQTTIIEWPSNGHNGGDLAFGLDGMLYVSAGDGTSDSDTHHAGQDLSTLTGSMLRIDVDHPSDDKPYSVPDDNPFVDLAGARPEIWAYGLRNPWRLSIDPKTGHLWTGINGQDLWETVQVVRRGENYGWSITEGSHPFQPNRKRGPTPIVAPTIEHPHSEARSLTGGDVYYGKQYPSLVGHYIYGDYSTGMIWAAKYDGRSVVSHFVVARTTLQISGFGIDHDGEILIADHGSGLYRLKASTRTTSTDFPKLLSQTGVFESTAENRVHPGLIPYEVNSALWSDGALKERYIGLPGDATIEFQSTKSWDFPEGTVLVKTFSLPLVDPGASDASGDTKTKRIETRLLARQEGQWYGYSYQWNHEQTDAELVDASGADREFDVVDSAVETGSRRQTWRFPSRSECMVCHSRAANFVLGLSAQQTNLKRDGDAVSQLERFAQFGMFHNRADANAGQRSEEASFVFPVPPDEIPRLADPRNVSQPLESRVRSYLHSNCANCHVDAGGGNSSINLSIGTSLDKTRLIDEGPLHDSFSLADARLVKPGTPSESVLLHRIRLRGRGQMPPLATSVVDEDAAKMIADWISQLAAKSE